MNHFPFLHYQNLARNIFHIGNNMCRQQHNPFSCAGTDQIPETNPLFWIEPCCRLVQNQNLRIIQQSLSDTQPLLHSTGKRPDFTLPFLSQSCQFKEVKSGREGVKRYLLVPAGSYAAEVDKQMKEEPVPSTCSGWGVGNSGMRYFEVQDSHPDRAVFIEIGQDAPLFDESSICLTAMDAVSDSTQVLYNLSGEVRIGHEVRSFRPENSDKEYWLVDKTGTLTEIYDRKTGGQKNGKPLQMMLKLEYNGKWDDGFAADYDGVYFVREVLDGQKNPEGLKRD